MLEKLREPFREGEVEFRIGQSGKKRDGNIWATCLAYISARAIQDRLDEVVGPENWQATYEFPIANSVICNLSLKINGEWITKQDGSEFTDVEPFKGGISSALKRAGSVWGMGRYLYSLESNFVEIVTDKKTPGAQYGKTKEGDVFYWVPPKLPKWALPKEENKEKLKEEDSETETKKYSDTHVHKKLMNLYRPYLVSFPETKFKDLLIERYGVEETKLMNNEQLNDLVIFMERRLKEEQTSYQVSELELNMIKQLMAEKKLSREIVFSIMHTELKKSKMEDLTQTEFGLLLNLVKNYKPKVITEQTSTPDYASEQIAEIKKRIVK